MRSTILLIEDDPGLAGSLKKELEAGGYEADVVERGEDGLARAKAGKFAVVIADFRVPGLSGLDLIGQLHTAKPRLPIILMTAYGTPETAIEATRLGAFEYLPKPFEMPDLLQLVARALACRRGEAEPMERADPEAPPVGMVGSSRAMRAVFKEIGHAAATSMTALIRGETGTGKELVARAIHEHSGRAGAPFIAVSCAALPQTLVETELFGSERGAYTGANCRRIGRFEQAQRGTIFLDEIGDLDLTTQVKLLRALQEKAIQRVGANERIPVDVRILAATHRDLERAMNGGQFREDLFYRLSALTIQLPPLRARLDDLLELVKCFLQRSAREIGFASLAIQRTAVEFLRAQTWPGNVRQLENVVRHASLLAGERPITLMDVRQAYGCGRQPLCSKEPTLKDYLTDLLLQAQRNEITDVSARMNREMERELFTLAIEQAQGNQARAARWLGISRTTMREKLVEFGLHPNGLRPTQQRLSMTEVGAGITES